MKSDSKLAYPFRKKVIFLSSWKAQLFLKMLFWQDWRKKPSSTADISQTIRRKKNQNKQPQSIIHSNERCSIKNLQLSAQQKAECMLGTFINLLVFRMLKQMGLTFFMTQLFNFLEMAKTGRAENLSNIKILTYERN